MPIALFCITLRFDLVPDEGAFSIYWGGIKLGTLTDGVCPFTTLIETTTGDWSDTITGLCPDSRIRLALTRLVEHMNGRSTP